ncbi:MAG: pyridoxamine 5'-phosphate oxidase family protein [Anaerolineae bacterium]|nr:pyridoxamine 5'-phosphate oxidase family protein [Anaerolineae bacterium]
MTTFGKTLRNRVKRLPERAAYDRETIYRILDEALICHVGIAVENQPFVIPMIHARRQDSLLMHGATSSRLLRHIQAGNPICVTTTILDGLVVARGVFHNSMNYRSVVLFGVGHILSDPQSKNEALFTLTERVMPGRWDDSRLPTRKELRATTIIELPIESATAKMRMGGPKDDAEDYAGDWWAGVIPIQQSYLPPQPDPKLGREMEAPPYLKNYKR